MGVLQSEIFHDSITTGSLFKHASKVQLICPCSSLATVLALSHWAHRAQTHEYTSFKEEDKLPQLAGVPNKQNKLVMNSALSMPTHLFGPVSFIWLFQSKKFCVMWGACFFFHTCRPIFPGKTLMQMKRCFPILFWSDQNIRKQELASTAAQLIL